MVLESNRPKAVRNARWLVLLLACLVLAGTYYNYDMPSALGTTLQLSLQATDTAFQVKLNGLYLASSLPNLVFPIISAILILRFGSSPILILFTFAIVGGQALFATGALLQSFPFLIAGRFIMGLSGDVVDVVVSSMLTEWFLHNNNLAFALGLNHMAARIFAAINDNVSPLLAEKQSVAVAAWVGVGVSTVGFASAIALATLNKDGSPTRSAIQSNSRSEQDQTAVGEPIAGGSEMSPQVSEWSSLMKQFVSLPRSFYLLCGITFLLYGATISFFNISTTFFVQKWGLAPSAAGMVLSVPDWIAMAGNPIAGLLLDRYGHRASSLVFSSLLLAAGHAVLQFTALHPAFGMSLIGISFAGFTTAVWVCVPLIVPAHQVSTAFALQTVILNQSAVVLPLVIPWIRNAGMDFSYVEYMFLGLCGAGASLSWILLVTEPSLNYAELDVLVLELESAVKVPVETVMMKDTASAYNISIEGGGSEVTLRADAVETVMTESIESLKADSVINRRAESTESLGATIAAHILKVGPTQRSRALSEGNIKSFSRKGQCSASSGSIETIEDFDIAPLEPADNRLKPRSKSEQEKVEDVTGFGPMTVHIELVP
ncbi:major facilitator superfamily domain-containing protein [Chytriomyces sp. MP71]|nr:major facilitator superfamily domain-containing protein [Chytriomyces sp. MP71]